MNQITWTALLKKFENNGEKTGWTYVEIPAALAGQLHAADKKSFRVKGFLDQVPISGLTLLPVGQGNYIISINATLRKALGKRAGATIRLRLQEDEQQYQLNQELLDCLKDDPAAELFFHQLSKSHQQYYSKWIDSAKTPATRIKRIALSVTGLSRKMNYPEMMRFHKNKAG